MDFSSIRLRLTRSLGWRVWLRGLILLVSLLILAPTVVAANDQTAATPPVHKTVLLLFPYHCDLPAQKLGLRAVQDEFSQVTDLKLNLHVECLDVNQFSDKAYQRQLWELYAKKYEHEPIDLVIVSDQLMLSLWLEQRNAIAPKAPVVFYDMPFENLSKLQILPGETGVVGSENHLPSVQWFLRARPEVNELVLVHGVGSVDQGFMQPVTALQTALRGQIKLTDLSDLPLAEIKRRVAVLPKTSVVLYHLMFEDASHLKYRPIDVLRELAQVSSVPVLSGYDQFIGVGTVGGYMYSVEKQAGQAARIGLRILRGEPVSSIPVVTNQVNPSIFDHRALLRWGIPLSALPADSIVKNRQYSFWESYQLQIIATSSGFAVLLLMVVFLADLSRRLSTARMALITANAGLTNEISERTKAQARLQLAASVFTHAREGILITDAAGTIVEVNETFSRITGYSREEILGKNPRMLQSARQTPEFYTAMWAALTGKGHWYGEVWNQRKNGELYAIMETISAVHDAAGVLQNYVALFFDITAMKQHEQQLEHIAHYDALTSLPNRVLLADRLQQAIIQSQRRNNTLAVVYLDLDGFKAVNDACGHEVGDELLIVLAQRMKAALRDGDTLARIGGDEFVAVLVDLALPQDCEPLLARLLQAASDPVTAHEQVFHLSASIGVTLYPQDGGDADLMLRRADQAMYAAKQAGRNRYHLFDVAQDVAIQTHHESLEQIHHALDREEFVLYYQPKVNMKTRQVIGLEALIRWQHPKRGLLPPSAFLPVIENHPFSVVLGEWVINTALQQMTAWHVAGMALPVSVNIGARQLQQDTFVPRLMVLLAAHPDLPRHCLELEVLETSALEDMANVSIVMHACREIGVHFALDDFGTGYSSLTYLRRLPAEVIKIDQSFVLNMLDDPDDLAIVKGVIGLAAAFRRQVIAEGVETTAHGERLLALGCELAQGYGIARPMPAHELPGWVTAWHAGGVWTA